MYAKTPKKIVLMILMERHYVYSVPVYWQSGINYTVLTSLVHETTTTLLRIWHSRAVINCPDLNVCNSVVAASSWHCSAILNHL